MKKSIKKLLRKRFQIWVILGFIALVLMLSFSYAQKFQKIKRENVESADLNKSGHSVYPNTTPFPTVKGVVRFNEYDPLSTSFSIREAGRKDVLIQFSKIDVEKAMLHSSIIGVSYVAKSNERASQLRQVKIKASDLGLVKLTRTLVDLHGDAFSFSFVQNDMPPFVLDNSNSYSNPIKMLYKGVLVLNLSEVQGLALAYVGGIEKIEGNYVLNDTLPVKYNGKNTPVDLLSFEQLKSSLYAGNYYMFWRDYRALPEYFYTDLGPDSTLVFNSVVPVYLAQSKGLIPGYMVCGYQELIESDGQTIHHDACGVTEAVDYGDY